MCKGFIDEKTRKKMIMMGTNYHKKLFEYCDRDQVPEFLGGTNTSDFTVQPGPWNDYEFVDGDHPD